jgi:hypothetical protein
VIVQVNGLYVATCRDEVEADDAMACGFRYEWGRHTPLVSHVDWCIGSQGVLEIAGQLRGYWASQYDIHVGGTFCLPIDPEPDDETENTDDFVVSDKCMAYFWLLIRK